MNAPLPPVLPNPPLPPPLPQAAGSAFVPMAPPPPATPPTPGNWGQGMLPAASNYQVHPVDPKRFQSQKRPAWANLESLATMAFVAPITTVLGGALGYMLAGPVGAAKGAVIGSSLPGAYCSIKECLRFARDLHQGVPNTKLEVGIMVGAIAVPVGASVGAWVGGLLGGPIGAGLGAAFVMALPSLALLYRMR